MKPALPHDKRVTAVLETLSLKYITDVRNAVAFHNKQNAVARFKNREAAIDSLVTEMTNTGLQVDIDALSAKKEHVLVTDLNDTVETPAVEAPAETTEAEVVARKGGKAKTPKTPKEPKVAKVKAEKPPAAPKRVLPPIQALPPGFRITKNAVITLHTDENPLREGTKMYPLFATYKTGQTVEEAYKNGMGAADVRYHVQRGWISLEVPPESVKEEVEAAA